MAGLSPRLRRALLLGGVILVFVLLAGATYQGVATALERREFPRPGGMVPVGDHQLHVYCSGHGSPAVILEGPAAAGSAAWGGVQERLAATTRVCSYDRAGIGWSEAGDKPFDPGRVPEELRALLSNAKEAGPFVVVGHGLGAVFAQMYAGRPDAEAVGLVMIAPPAGARPRPDADAWMMPISPWLARTGVLRAARLLSSKAQALDGQAGGAVRAFLNRPDHLTRTAAELAKWDDALKLAAGTPVRPDVPAVTVDVRRTDRVAFLTDPGDVDRVVQAIEQVVRTSRERSAAP